MGQTNRSSRNNTRITVDPDGTRTVRLHRTDIVKVSPNGDIVLNSGGWQTVTTKARINQVASEWELGFVVYQDNFQWWIQPIGAEPRLFSDGARFNLNGVPVWKVGPTESERIALDW